ncbi:SAM-dependent DNA methyltransferase [Pseudoalteromonas sp. SR44-8]|uniref:type I restriction-modification system subunit M n=1 Tax=Pseudoalteromonas sp. SR44-8 TaxID=2760933 RepID=UPI00160182DE|nr:class I SAM-dependent DNA methyltransferase [Pseudoalteromonas sp. SR44-8]MBB1303034.1 SAM-dependent DNA methyltransferase [Pseudoalteromonas sp. SR44-8]
MIELGQFKEHSNKVWEIANLLRGPYRPPQYRRVMIPLTVLKRLDSVLIETKQQVLEQYEKLVKANQDEETIEQIILQKFDLKFFNTSNFTFKTLLDDPDKLAANLNKFIAGFSERARDIIEKFSFAEEIEKLEDANRLFEVVKAMADVDLHPNRVPNDKMGNVFEDLVRRFNEQANEEAGDHYTPREVVKLMVNLLFTGEEQIHKAGKVIKIYDPACGTGGILSEAERTIIDDLNSDANIELFGQEYNAESYAICGSDLMIKGEDVNNVVYGNTLGTGKFKEGFADGDGHPNEKFHYMAANPPFGVEWKPEKDNVTKEHDQFGFNGRFGPGLPRINDGALLFLMHMMSKMERPPQTYKLPAPGGVEGGRGSRIAVVFNGSPMFTGDAGGGESNIRRYILENDMLEAIVGLPDQMFYNTGIYTYIWIVTNRKEARRKGTVQLINATDFAWKMKKSLGDKRKKIGEGPVNGDAKEPDHITEITRLYANYENDITSTLNKIGTNLDSPKDKKRDKDRDIFVSKIFNNQDFGYFKVTVERPLRLNFIVNDERIERVKESDFFINLATSAKRKNKEAIADEIAAGKIDQEELLRIFLEAKKLYADNELVKDRKVIEAQFKKLFATSELKFDAAMKKALLSHGAFGEKDPTAKPCLNTSNKPEPDAELRDYENIPLPGGILINGKRDEENALIDLPLPLDYETKKTKGKVDTTELLALAKVHCERFLAKEVLPYRDDAWIDYSKIKVGYEISFNRHFYDYQEPRPLAKIEGEIKTLETDIMKMLAEVI